MLHKQTYFMWSSPAVVLSYLSKWLDSGQFFILA